MHPNQEAVAAPAPALAPVRWSNLKWMGRSPAHFRYYRDNPTPQTDPMRVGDYAHALVLGTEQGRFAEWTGGRRFGKEWDLFSLRHPDATILTSEQMDRGRGVADAVLANDTAMQLLYGRVMEERREWTIAGRACHGTPDAVGPNSIVELKITADASPDRFPWHARRMGWIGQLSWYDRGVFGGHAASLWIVAVESKPPHAVTVFKLAPETCEFGTRSWRLYFERLLVCERSNHWPSYCESAVTLELESDFSVTVDGEEVEL